MRIISDLAELKSLVGQELAITDWIAVDQERVNQFAQATGDHQWIHVDVARSERESPFGGTIAHGFLTLSLIPLMLEQCVSMLDVQMALNYGLNKVRFPSPLLAGKRVRGHIVVQSVDDIKDGAQVVWQVTVECEGSDKPVCVAEMITRRYP
jgi:acyl dehydratase